MVKRADRYFKSILWFFTLQIQSLRLLVGIYTGDNFQENQNIRCQEAMPRSIFHNNKIMTVIHKHFSALKIDFITH